MKYLAFAAATLFGVTLLTAPTFAACKDELAMVQKEVAAIKDVKKADSVKKLWSEADTALKGGNEKACMDKVTAARKEAGLK
jgi:hypothetical protein